MPYLSFRLFSGFGAFSGSGVTVGGVFEAWVGAGLGDFSGLGDFFGLGVFCGLGVFSGFGAFFGFGALCGLGFLAGSGVTWGTGTGSGLAVEREPGLGAGVELEGAAGVGELRWRDERFGGAENGACPARTAWRRCARGPCVTIEGTSRPRAGAGKLRDPTVRSRLGGRWDADSPAAVARPAGETASTAATPSAGTCAIPAPMLWVLPPNHVSTRWGPVVISANQATERRPR